MEHGIGRNSHSASREKTTVSQNSGSSRAGVLLLISGMEFILMVMVCESIYPGYSVHSNAISDLGATSARSFLLYEPAIVSWGFLWLLGSYLYWRGSRGKSILALNMLPGLGILIVASFPENVNLLMHSVGSVVGIFSGIIVVLFSAMKVRGVLRYLILGLGVISLAAAIVEFGSYGSQFVQQTLGPGGWERAIIYPLLIWEVAFGAHIINSDVGGK